MEGLPVSADSKGLGESGSQPAYSERTCRVPLLSRLVSIDSKRVTRIDAVSIHSKGLRSERLATCDRWRTNLLILLDLWWLLRGYLAAAGLLLYPVVAVDSR